jgi:hypothetical protein
MMNVRIKKTENRLYARWQITDLEVSVTNTVSRSGTFIHFRIIPLVFTLMRLEQSDYLRARKENIT